jgi:hypothetical protein
MKDSILDELTKLFPHAKISIDPIKLIKFKEICSIVESEDEEKLKNLPYVDRPSISVIANNRTIYIPPMTYLAYHAKHEAIKFLLEDNDNDRLASYGYAMAGNTEFFSKIRVTYFNYNASVTNSIIMFLGYSGHFQHIFSFYNKEISTDSERRGKNPSSEQFVDVLIFKGITKNLDSLHYWLLENKQFRKHPLLLDTLDGLKERKIIKDNPFPLMQTAALLWNNLYVWFLQRPRLMKNALPNVIIKYVASFLCEPAVENLLSKFMPFKHSQQLLLLNLNSIAEKTQQREAPNRLITFFKEIKDCKSFHTAIRKELDNQNGESNEEITQALQNCQSRLSVALS